MTSRFHSDMLAAGVALTLFSAHAALAKEAAVLSPYEAPASPRSPSAGANTTGQAQSWGAAGEAMPVGGLPARVNPGHAELRRQIQAQVPSYDAPMEPVYGQMSGMYGQGPDSSYGQLTEGWMRPGDPGYGHAEEGWGQPSMPLRGDGYGVRVPYGYGDQVPYYQPMPGQTGLYHGGEPGWQQGLQPPAQPYYPGAHAPDAEHRQRMLDRLDAIVGVLERIEKLLQGRGQD